MMKHMAELDNWWSSLRVSEKERIAGKIAGEPVSYPECTRVWNGLSPEKKQHIRDHCMDRHGLLDPEEFEGTPLTD